MEDAAASNHDAVKKVFETYRTALLNADGKTAAGVVAAETTEAYEKYRVTSIKFLYQGL